MPVTPFTIHIPQTVLDDLQTRLARTRWPDEIEGSGWQYGFNFQYMQELVAYWQNTYDWRKHEALLNQFHHFMADVDGMRIHFIHEKGKGPNPMPLVLTHGWPGSFLEMLSIIPMLTDPVSHGGSSEDAFDVVVPSLPGFGFSARSAERGMNIFRTADLWAGLMTQLGYERFGAQGGDFGAGVSTVLALKHPGRIAGLHLNYIPGSYKPHIGPDDRPLSEIEKKSIQDDDDWYEREGGYSHVQRTKPQTLSYALNESPVGLAAWIIEKFRDWADCGGDVEKRFMKDELLTNVMIYWVTETIGSSVRYYFEGRLAPLVLKKGERVEVPCGIARFPLEEPFPPREWVERGFNVVHWTEMPRGGHFAAAEEPELLAQDIREFFKHHR